MKKMALLPGLLFAVALQAQTVSNEAATGPPPGTAVSSRGAAPAAAASLHERAERQGSLEALLFQKRYGCDDYMLGAVKDIYIHRQMAVDELLNAAPGSAAARNGQLMREVEDYNIQIEHYVTAAEGMAYFKKNVIIMEGLKPLTQAQKDDLRNFYLASCIQEDKHLSMSFRDAMHVVIKDTAYYAVLYRDEINMKAKSDAAEKMEDMMKKNNLTKDGMKSLFPLVMEREKKLALIDFSFPLHTAIKDSLENQVHRHYDPLVQANLEKDGSGMPSSQFAIAIKFRKDLDITPEQVDSLLVKSAALRLMKSDFQEKNPMGKFDSKAFESENMAKIVTEDQYTKVLILKNRSEAQSNAEQDWQELEQRSMSGMYSKENTLKELKEYYLTKLCIYYRYANDKLKQSVNGKNLQEHMPTALRALTSARKNNNSVDNTAGASYHW